VFPRKGRFGWQPAHPQMPLQQYAVLTFLVSEETAAADDLGNLGWHHLVPGFVPLSDALEHVA